MDWWGPSLRIERTISPDELLFVAISLRRKGDLLIAGVALGLGIVALSLSSIEGAIVLFFCGSVWGYKSLRTSTHRLHVTRDRLTGDGSGPAYATSIAWREVVTLRYEIGSEDSPSGLVASRGVWDRNLLLRDVSEAQCLELLTEIYTHFPNLEMAPAPPTVGEWLSETVDEIQTMFFPRKKGQPEE